MHLSSSEKHLDLKEYATDPVSTPRLPEQLKLELQVTGLMSGIRKLGAEIHLAKIDAERSGGFLRDEDYTAYWMHILLFQSEIAKLLDASEATQSESAEQIRAVAKRFVELTQAWDKNVLSKFIDPSDIDIALEGTREYFNSIDKAYARLSALTTLEHIPDASNLGLSILEFDTEFSGVPLEILPEVVEFESQLLIDPSLNKPQNGFARVETEAELEQILSLRESRLLVAMQDNQLQGFIIPTFNPESVKHVLGKEYDKILEKKVIRETDKVAWCEIIGTVPKLSHARQQFNIADLFDETLNEALLALGHDVLLAIVREGPNLNLAIKSHLRRGMQLTEHSFMGPDGVTPYRVIARRVVPTEDWSNVLEQVKAKYPFWECLGQQTVGYNSHFDLAVGAVAKRSNVVEGAKYISNREAVSKCRSYFDKYKYGLPEIHSVVGYHAFYIQFRGAGGSLYNLHQNRPRSDSWKYFKAGGYKFGTLDDLLPLVAQDMGFPLLKEPT